MANIQRNFIAGRMNKSLDERLIPNGEYEDALNVRLGSTEGSEIGSVENSKGNTKLTSLQYEETGSTEGSTLLSAQARCIGSFEDGKNNRIYWFVHDPEFTVGPTGKIDLIVSFNPTTQNLIYHVVSINDGFSSNTTLNFNPKFLINGIDLVDNLLFFTDNVNPPRVINVTTNYSNPVFNNDVITAEQLMVIKKPPVESPVLNLLSQSNSLQDDFLETRFICFAYRYRYSDGEFSATSQWSRPAFAPGFFNYNFTDNLNQGMLNTITSIGIQFDSGSSLVTGIQLLYKESTDSTIKIIDTFNKSIQGYADNTKYSFSFNSSKIFTILPPTELLRLYDNVPLLAQAQTVMSNRLVYGNYIEGYDLKDVFNVPIQLNYVTGLIQGEIKQTALTSTTESGNYTFGSTQTIPNSVAVIDFSLIDPLTELIAGSSININFTFEHYSFDPTAGEPTTITNNININFVFDLPGNYNSVYDMVFSNDFKQAIGTVANIKPVYAASGETSCDGFTLTDNINCLISTTLDLPSTGTVTKFQSGITAANQPIKIIDNDPGVNKLKLQMPAMRFVADPTAPVSGYYEYYKVISVESVYTSNGNPSSLHSNRGYEIGIVYMDEFLRSSTALVSPTNTIQIPCSASVNQNKIEVTIPAVQRAPYWANRYKFVIKPTKSTYETIYSEQYFKDPRSNSYFFLLEGENAAKIESGQRLIVKRDTSGPLTQCVEVVVIDKKVQTKDFLEIINPLGPPLSNPIPVGYYINVPAGPYMEIIPNGININKNDGLGGDSISYPSNTISYPGNKHPEGFAIGQFRVNIENPDTTAAANAAYLDYSIPQGSVITISINQTMLGAKGLISSQERNNLYESPPLIASTNYSNFKSWFDGDNIGELITRDSTSDQTGSAPTNTYLSTELLVGGTSGVVPLSRITKGNASNSIIPLSDKVLTYQFYRSDPANNGDNSLWFLATGFQSQNAFTSSSSVVSINITVQRANEGGLVVFETIPSDALSDVWYENEESFEVNDIGEHEGSLGWQNISTNTSAIVKTSFFDCFSFSNGVESYTIRDSIKGEAFALGNRVTTTSEQEYKESHRFADLTYSGIFNDESNVNRLNEFNLGLLNFKPLEDSFGSIQKLYARQTDILTLQEDKISYVLAGKDLLSDAGGTGALTSVPTVLGQQIARLEEFGISRNPESFAVFGADKFFTDEQRGAVIQLKGGAYNNESLAVISETGMRGWFRDLFHDNFDSQKLGGFDPYMNEYVLSANSIKLPFAGNCDVCGSTRNVSIEQGKVFSYCVDVTQEVGTVEIEYVIPSGGNDNIITQDNTPNVGGGLVKMITETGSNDPLGNDIVIEDSTNNNTYTISAFYNGIKTTVTTNVNGILIVDKNSVYADNLTVIVSSNSITSDTLEITVGCPVADNITIFNVTITSNSDRDKLIHNQYRWDDLPFRSAPQGNQVRFKSGLQNPLQSQFIELEAPQGANLIPGNGSTVSIISHKIPGEDNYDFQPNTNNFRYLRTSTFYGKSTTELNALLAASTIARPMSITQAPAIYSADFVMPTGGANDYLYLIWDYRNSTRIQLCFSNVSANNACCVGCNVDINPDTTTVIPGKILCKTHTLTSPSECITYSLRNDDSGGASTNVDYTKCIQGTPGVVRNLFPDLLPSQEPEVCSSTVPVFDNGNGTPQAGAACGGSSNTFNWLSCDGVTENTETVQAGKNSVVCSQSIPIRTLGTSGTIVGGAVCSEYYYKANNCNESSDIATVFLSANKTLGLYNIGNVVYYDEINLSGSNISTRKCATITERNIGNGANGEILGISIGCQDTTYCPSLLDNTPVWMFDLNENQGSSTAPTPNSARCVIPVFTSIRIIADLFDVNTLFYVNRALNTPFNGNNKFFAFRQPPPAPAPPFAEQGFPQGWIQIDNNGRVLAYQNF